MTELIWKPIAGYEGIYEISNVGVVRSVERIASNGSLRRAKVLRPWLTGGYPTVALSKGSRVKKQLVHRLVAEAFLPKIPGKDFVNHKNGVKTDPQLGNLEWCSLAENNAHALETGLNTNMSPGVGNGNFRGWLQAESLSTPGFGYAFAGAEQLQLAGFNNGHAYRCANGFAQQHKGFRFVRIAL